MPFTNKKTAFFEIDGFFYKVLLNAGEPEEAFVYIKGDGFKEANCFEIMLNGKPVSKEEFINHITN